MTMKILHFFNIDISPETKFDLFISSFTKAPRSKQIAQLLEGAIFEQWAVLEGDKENTLSVDSRFGPSVVPVSVEGLYGALREWLARCQNNVPTVFVDISSMSRPVMASLITAMSDFASDRQVELKIGYVIASFSPPPTTLPPNEDIRPISESLAGWPNDTSAKTALIVALGYETGKAEGACEYFDASDTWAFIPKSPLVQYDEQVLKNNDDFIRRVSARNRVINYPVDNPAQAFGELASVISILAPRSNPIVLPFGPKVFFIFAALLSFLYPQMGVWHVSSDNSDAADDQVGSKYVVGFCVALGPMQKA